MGAETSNELGCESECFQYQNKYKYIITHYLHIYIYMGCLSRKGINILIYIWPSQQNIVCHPAFSGCPFNRLFLQVHICHMPSLYFSNSTLKRTPIIRTKGTWVFLNVADTLDAALENVKWNSFLAVEWYQTTLSI